MILLCIITDISTQNLAQLKRQVKICFAYSTSNPKAPVESEMVGVIDLDWTWTHAFALLLLNHLNKSPRRAAMWHIIEWKLVNVPIK